MTAGAAPHRRRPLYVGVADLRKRTGIQRDVHTEADLDGLVLSSAAIVAAEPVVVDLVLESLPESIVATGAVEASWAGECRRCLEPVSGRLRTDVREVFEAHPVEGETYPLADDHIDLEPMVRDALMLALPLAPLCEEACAGPDPEEHPVVPAAVAEGSGQDPRWAALDELRFE